MSNDKKLTRWSDYERTFNVGGGMLRVTPIARGNRDEIEGFHAMTDIDSNLPRQREFLDFLKGEFCHPGFTPNSFYFGNRNTEGPWCCEFAAIAEVLGPCQQCFQRAREIPTFKASGLTFSLLREANKRRLPEFRNSEGGLAHSKPDGSDWSPAQWLQALVGEIGEFANWRKKFERGDISFEEFKKHAAKELADVQTYLSLLAGRCLDHGDYVDPQGIDLGTATVDKFNEVSNRVGSSVYISPDGTELWHRPSLNKVYKDQGDTCNGEQATDGTHAYIGVTNMGHSLSDAIGKRIGGEAGRSALTEAILSVGADRILEGNTKVDQQAVGLYGKYHVSRTDGRDAPGQKHFGAQYFVLNMNIDHDPHAAAGLLGYALSCQSDYPKLAEDLLRHISGQVLF